MSIYALHDAIIIIRTFLCSHILGVSIQGLYKVNEQVLSEKKKTPKMNAPQFPTCPVGGNLVLLNLQHVSPVFITTEHLPHCRILELRVHGANENRVIFH